MSSAQTLRSGKAVTSLFEKGTTLPKQFLASFGAIALTGIVLALIAAPFFASETTLKEIGGFAINIAASAFAFVIALLITAVAIAILAIGFGYPPSKWDFPQYKDKALEFISRARVYLSTLRSAK